MTNEDQTRPQAQQPRIPTAPSARPTDETQELAVAAPPKLEISPAQIAGSALAAVSSAFFASWAGTTGTLIGVAAGSVIATVGAATYTWWLRRTQEAVRRRAALVRQTTLAANGLPRTVAVGPLRRRGDREGDATRQDLTTVAGEPVDPSPTDEEPLPGRWALPWKKVLLTSVAVMLLALAVITGFEAITGRTVASYTGGNGGSGSTVGNVLGEDSSTKEKQPSEKSTPTPTPTPSPSSSPTDGATDGAQDGTGGTDGTDGTTPAPTPTPTVPTPSSGTTSTPGVPDSTSTPDSGSTALP